MNTIKDSKVALVTTDAPGHERTFELMVWVDEVRLIEITREECARLGAMLVKASEREPTEEEKAEIDRLERMASEIYRDVASLVMPSTGEWDNKFGKPK